MSNICREYGYACDLANISGYCKVTGCLRRNVQANIITPNNNITKIYCGATDCKYNKQSRCTKDEIHLFMIDDLYKGCDDWEWDEESELIL